MPTLRNWSAAVLATATEVGSFDATPMTSDSCLPSLLIRPRMTSGGPVLTGAVVVLVAGAAVAPDVLSAALDLVPGRREQRQRGRRGHRGRRGRLVARVARRADLGLVQRDGVVAAGADGGEQIDVEQAQNRLADLRVGQLRLVGAQRELHDPRCHDPRGPHIGDRRQLREGRRRRRAPGPPACRRCAPNRPARPVRRRGGTGSWRVSRAGPQ